MQRRIVWIVLIQARTPIPSIEESMNMIALLALENEETDMQPIPDMNSGKKIHVWHTPKPTLYRRTKQSEEFIEAFLAAGDVGEARKEVAERIAVDLFCLGFFDGNEDDQIAISRNIADGTDDDHPKIAQNKDDNKDDDPYNVPPNIDDPKSNKSK